jgi:ribosomal-protein-alanine N-acetyltransferase
MDANMPMLDTRQSPVADLAPGVIGRPLSDADVPEVTAMERVACVHPLHAWTDENYRSSLRAGYWARVLCEADTGRVVAVCVAMDGVDEVHLLNIAVALDCHGRGLARALMAELVWHCRQCRAEALWLEVRPSNTRARALYLREGFADVGLRKRYYPAASGREDALVMRRLIELSEELHALD